MTYIVPPKVKWYIILLLSVLFQIYVEFGSADDSKTAAQALAGRKFANRVVVTSFYSPEMFHRKEFHWYARSCYVVSSSIESSKARNLSSVPLGAIFLEFLWNSFFVYRIFSIVHGSYSNKQANMKIGLGFGGIPVVYWLKAHSVIVFVKKQFCCRNRSTTLFLASFRNL